MNNLPEWKTDEVSKLYFCVFLGIFAGGLFLDPVVKAAEAYGPTWQALSRPMLGVISFHGIGLLWVHLFLKAHGVRWSQILKFHNDLPVKKGWMIGMGLGLGLIVISIVVNQISAAVLTSMDSQVESQEVVKLVQKHAEIPAALIFFFMSAVILGPIVEELLFRGVLFRFLYQLNLRKTAYAISALLFAIMHGNAMGFVSFIILALVFAWVYQKFQTLSLCIIAHMVFNGIQFLLIVAVAYQGEQPDLESAALVSPFWNWALSFFAPL
jgi:membrane protease YdiL (CAAX protease family)